MKNKRILYIAVLIMTLLFMPASVDAKEYNQNNTSYKVEEKWYQEDSIFLASTVNKNVQILADCNNSILGSTSDPDSVAWLLQQILNLFSPQNNTQEIKNYSDYYISIFLSDILK